MPSIPRPANQSDVPRLVELAREEHARSPWAKHEFEAAAVRATITQFIYGVGRTLITTDGGYLAGLLQPIGFSRQMLALEYAWFSTDGRGMAMLDRFLQWASNMGATSVVVHSYMGDDRLPNILRRRRGFVQLGQAMVRDLRSFQ